MCPIDAIQEIAQRDDRSRAVVFFFYFARFEYALKRAGFVTTTDDAQPDWDAFGNKYASVVATDQTPELLQAMAYLTGAPPKKQVVTNAGLEWSDDNFNGAFDLLRGLVLLRRVRNNLFHGGKFQSGLAAEVSRDMKLLNASLAVMEACLRSAPNVGYHFTEGLFW
jgi:hypothetical protein